MPKDGLAGTWLDDVTLPSRSSASCGAEKLFAEGPMILQAAEQPEISERTYYRWRNQYGETRADAESFAPRPHTIVFVW